VIRAVVSDFGGVLTAPLIEGFALVQADTGVPPRAFGEALARAGDPNPLFALEVGAITEAEFIAALERELEPILGRAVDLHGFAGRYMGSLAANDALFDYYRGLHGRGIRLAVCTNNVREWEPLWRAKLPIDEIFETVVDSAFVGLRKPDPRIYALVLERLELPAEAAAALGFAGVHFEGTEQAITALDALLDGR
jgi:putative hydrolase of the HAD superfamily